MAAVRLIGISYLCSKAGGAAGRGAPRDGQKVVEAHLAARRAGSGKQLRPGGGSKQKDGGLVKSAGRSPANFGIINARLAFQAKQSDKS